MRKTKQSFTSLIFTVFATAVIIKNLLSCVQTNRVQRRRVWTDALFPCIVCADDQTTVFIQSALFALPHCFTDSSSFLMLSPCKLDAFFFVLVWPRAKEMQDFFLLFYLRASPCLFKTLDHDDFFLLTNKKDGLRWYSSGLFSLK